MFTGIVEATGLIENIKERAGSYFVEVSFPRKWKIKPGSSVAIDGICTTIRRMRGPAFVMEYMPETIKKTTLKYWRKGREVNLERPVMAGDRMGGGFVQGHIDGIGRIIGVKNKGLSRILKIKISGSNSRYVALRGGITVNGVNLTVARAGSNWLLVSLVSYTLEHTNLERLQRGDFVNIETDILAKYANRKHAART